MKELIIGIDAGTSVIKSIAFDLQGNQLESASLKNEYTLISGGGAEQNLNQTWIKTAETLTLLGQKIPDLSSRIAAIAVTGQGDGTWLVNGSGEPVMDGFIWLDARASHIAEEISATPANRSRFEITGTGLNACQQGPQLLWIKKHQPDAFTSAEHAFHCKDWLYYKLTGDIATDPSEGIFSFGDFRTREYSDQVIDALGLTDNKRLLPDIVDGSAEAGALSQGAAENCGLPAGTPVVMGYVDVVCTALGSGLYAKQGQRGCSIVGSTGMHMKLARNSTDINLNDDCTGYTMCMPIPGVCAQIQSNMAATLNIDWLLDLADGLFKDLGVKISRADVLSKLDAWVASAKPAELMYQPYISEAGERGPFIDTNARAGFVGLCSRHGVAELARAIFEGLGMAARDCYAAMGSLPGEITLSGGASRSRQLLEIIAASIESNIQTSTREEAGAAGAAMIAAVAIGHYQHMDDCVKEWVDPLMGEIVAPDPSLVSTYRRSYPVYRHTHRSLQPIWQLMAENRP